VRGNVLNAGALKKVSMRIPGKRPLTKMRSQFLSFFANHGKGRAASTCDFVQFKVIQKAEKLIATITPGLRKTLPPVSVFPYFGVTPVTLVP
jgi:hypothetical protein